MNKIFFVLALFILSTPIVSFADDSQQVITLKDGSQIKGVLAGINNGVYTVTTPIIGEVHVAAGDVASITSGNAASVAALPANIAPSQATGSLPANMDQQIAATQQRLMASPQNMQMVQKMAQDPEILQALQDPALQQAIQSHDYQAIQNNPAIQKLMLNPDMQALAKQLAGQQQQQSSSSQ